jgi:hypothetical protein
MLTPILLTLLTVAAVTGLEDNLATESKAKAQKVAHNSRLAKQLNTRGGRSHVYRHNNGYRPSYVHSDKHNQLHYSNYEAPKLQYGPFGSTKHQHQQPTYNPYVPVYPETSYSRPQTSNHDSSTYIYPLSYFTEPPPTYAYTQPSYPSPAYSQSDYVTQSYTEAPYYTTTVPQYPPIFYKDLKKIKRPYDAVIVTRPTGHDESHHNGYANNHNEYAGIPYEYANIPNEYADNHNEYTTPSNEYTNNQNQHSNNPINLVKIPNTYANSHGEYANSNTYKEPVNNHDAYVNNPNENPKTPNKQVNNLNKDPNIPNKYANSHNEFENNANDFPKFDDFLKHSLTQFPNFKF